MSPLPALSLSEALAIIAQLHRIPEGRSAESPSGIDSGESESHDVRTRAHQLGLASKTVTLTPLRLVRLPKPILIPQNAGGFLLVLEANEQTVQVASRDGRRAISRSLRIQDVCSAIGDAGFVFKSLYSEYRRADRLDFSWFIPSLVKHRKLLAEVFGVSLLLQVLALAAPLLSQGVMDKVIAHHATDTLHVIVACMAAVAIAECVLSLVRSYVLTHTTNRIDVELGSALFRHLLKLPVSFFEGRSVGDITSKVKELDGLRQLLTGTALTLVIDVVFSFAYLAILSVYSAKLTLIVVAGLPCYFLVTAVISPLLKQRLELRQKRSAEAMSTLVESVSGIQTIKSSGLEGYTERLWNRLLAAQTRANFSASQIASVGNECISMLSKLSTAFILLFGVGEVMAGEMTLGMYIAFNMLAGRVSQPIMRISQLWLQFQEAGISMGKLADILNEPSESGEAAHVSPRLQGNIQIRDLEFTYPGGISPSLRDVSINIPAGGSLGIVGRSGSGKSTLARLLQGLLSPTKGAIQIDGVDVRNIDKGVFRSQVGVVLQDSMLFNRSIQENIAPELADTEMDRVIEVAKLAGAHDFVMELPNGYNTIVGERGALLSGGQRQRIAIARALFRNPRILIFDEATSALDYESEAVIQGNMAKISQGRTTIIIAHRLSAVRHCHRIITIERGQIAEFGSHDDLINGSGLYAHLWKVQANVRPISLGATNPSPPVEAANAA